MGEGTKTDGGDGSGVFPVTRWSVVVAARGGGGADEEGVRRALGELCGIYWYPLYVYARRAGNGAEAAEDLVQGFFASLVARSSMRSVEREKGKLRSFLLAGLKKHMASEWRKASAEKRGGGQVMLSIDYGDGETRYAREVGSGLSPDEVFERRWALTLLERVMGRLEASYAERGKGEVFAVLKGCLEWNSGGETYAAVAEVLGMKENAVKQAALRMRTKFRGMLEDEIAETVGSEEDVEGELESLIRALGR